MDSVMIAASPVQKAVLARDGNCVFCRNNFRQHEHAINYIPPLHILEYRGKMYAACDYHAHLIGDWSISDIRRKIEMRRFLRSYLEYKENPSALIHGV